MFMNSAVRQNKKINTKIFLTVLLGVVLVAGLVFGGLVLFTPRNDDYLSQDDADLDRAIAEAEDEWWRSQDERYSEWDDDTELVAGELSVSISVEVEDGYIWGFGTVSGTTDERGECVWTFASPDGVVIERRSEGMRNWTNVACLREGVPVGQNGRWTVSLRYILNGEEGFEEVVHEVR